jgi:hypothetical protein
MVTILSSFDLMAIANFFKSNVAVMCINRSILSQNPHFLRTPVSAKYF